MGGTGRDDSSLGRLKSWAKKHKKALWITAGVVGAGMGGYYFLNLLQARAKTREEEEDVRTALLQTDGDERADPQFSNSPGALSLQSHFESIQRISDSTTLPSVLPHLKARLFELVNLSSLTEKLTSAKADPQTLSSREKLNLWQELKVQSFTRTVCAMWSVTLLDLFIRTQLNILGRHVYIDTAREMSVARAGEQHKPLSMSCQHKFIAFADFLPHKGVDDLMRHVHAAVDSVLRMKPLKDPYTIADLRVAFEKIRESYRENQESWEQYVLPDDNTLPEHLVAASSAADEARLSMEESTVLDDGEKLEILLAETRSVLSSNEFINVMEAAIDAVLEAVLEDLSVIYRNNPEFGIPLAKLLPPVASAGNLLMEHPDDNRFIQLLAQLPHVYSFCRMVYSSST